MNPTLHPPAYEVICDALIVRVDPQQPDKARRYTLTLDLLAVPASPSPLAQPQRLPSWSTPLSAVVTETVEVDGKTYALGEVAALVGAAVDALKQRALAELIAPPEPPDGTAHEEAPHG